MTTLDLVRKVGKRLGHLVVCDGCKRPMRVIAMRVPSDTQAVVELQCRCDPGCDSDSVFTYLAITGDEWDEAMICVPPLAGEASP